jgi:hypothetical protein
MVVWGAAGAVPRGPDPLTVPAGFPAAPAGGALLGDFLEVGPADAEGGQLAGCADPAGVEAVVADDQPFAAVGGDGSRLTTGRPCWHRAGAPGGWPSPLGRCAGVTSVSR